jgi:hypothetical protein
LFLQFTMAASPLAHPGHRPPVILPRISTLTEAIQPAVAICRVIVLVIH